MKAFFDCVAYGLSSCCKYWLFFRHPIIWAWFPFIAVERYYNKEMANQPSLTAAGAFGNLHKKTLSYP